MNTPEERAGDSLRTVPLSPQDATSYRSNVMRLAYLSPDRIELQFASKELARAMAGPTTADVEALKRCIRSLLKYPRCIQSFERQDIVSRQITCFSDSNLSSCLQSGKSTSSCKIFCGRHLLKSTSTTQAVVFQCCVISAWFCNDKGLKSSESGSRRSRQSQPGNQVGRNGRASHCNAKRYWTH